MQRVLVALVAALMLTLVPGAASAATDPPPPGRTASGSVTWQGLEYPYLVYTPPNLKAGAPLVVMVHGAQTAAKGELYTDRLTAVADRDGFALLYPDVDVIARTIPGPLNNSWKFYYLPVYARDGGDSGAIAAATRKVMADLNSDRERIYLAGISAGGLMASIDGPAFPELYAAYGIIESAGYGDGLCFTTGTGIPAELSAQLAFAQMASRARVVPGFVITSTGDLAFPASCGNKAMDQMLRMNNLVLSNSQTAPLSLEPALIARGQVPGGRSYTTSTYRDPAGCVVGEKTVIDGMPHAWPGGTADPAYNSDEKSPSAAEIAWRFFRRYTRSSTAMPCAEVPVEKKKKKKCPARPAKTKKASNRAAQACRGAKR